MDATTNIGRNGLHAASEGGNLENVRFWVEDFKLNVSVEDIYGWTALHLASQQGHENVVRYLVKAHLAIQTKNTGETPWQLAGSDTVFEIFSRVDSASDVTGENLAQQDVPPNLNNRPPPAAITFRHDMLGEIMHQIQRNHDENMARHEETQTIVEATQITVEATQTIVEATQTIVEATQITVEATQTILRGINANLDRAIGGLTYIATHKVQPCPPIAWLVPVGVEEHSKENSNCLETWKNWMRKTTHKSYHLYFVCQETLEIVNHKVEIKVERDWLKKVAPLLAVGVFAIQMGLAMRDLPDFPFPALGLSCQQKIELINYFVKEFLDVETSERVSNFRKSCEKFGIAPTEGTRNLEFFGPSYKSMVHQATKEGQDHWRKSIVPVFETGSTSRIIWVKRELESNYVRPNLEA